MSNPNNTTAPAPGVPLQSRLPEPAPPGIFSCKHKTAAFFTLLFKVSAFLFYVLATLILDSFVITFIVVVLLLAFDFWTVKNISGRLLAGLRWWNEVGEDGTNRWHFESARDPTTIDAIDSRVFWASLYVTPVVWVLLAIVAVLKFNFGWLLICAVAIALSASNTYGYMQCDKDARKRVERMAKVGALLM
jgi:hypothetical protein